MEDNNKNNEKEKTKEVTKEQVSTAETVKKEAATAVKQVKSTIKNTDLKKDANEAKGFFISLFKNPIKEVEKVCQSSKNKFLKIAIIVLIVWLVSTLIRSIIDVINTYSHMSTYYFTFENFFKNSVSNIWIIVRQLITPIISLAVLSVIVFLLQKEEKKPFINVVTAIIIAKIPVALSSVILLLNEFGIYVYKLTGPFSSFCSAISTVLLYFTVKSLYKEKEDQSFFKRFALILALYYVAKFIVSFFGISI